MKLYGTFNKPIITLCQYYSGNLPFKFLLDLKMMNFYHKMSFGYTTPAEILFRWFGKNELLDLFHNYDISENDHLINGSLSCGHLLKYFVTTCNSVLTTDIRMSC